MTQNNNKPTTPMDPEFTKIFNLILWFIFLTWLLTSGEPDLLDAIIERVGRP